MNPISPRLTRALQLFTLAAGLVLAAGGFLLLGRTGGQPASFGVFRGQPAFLITPAAIIHYALRGNPAAVVQLGVLLLVAAPALRVLAAGLGYLRSRDYLYTTVSAIVLTVLLFSFFSHR